MVAKVLGPNDQPLADQLVEWTLDRQGVGEILAVPNDAKVVKPSERPWPTFARTFTAKSPYRLDASLGGAEIQVGETWIAVESASAGGMHAAVASAGDQFVERRPGGGVLPLGPREGGISRADHRAGGRRGGRLHEGRFERRRFAASGLSHSVHGDRKQRRRVVRAAIWKPKAAATARLKRRSDKRCAKPGVTRGKIELLGRRPLPGRSAVVLAAGDFSINWTAPTIALASKFPSSWRLGETVAGSVVVQNKGDSAVKGLKVRQEIPSGDSPGQRRRRRGRWARRHLDRRSSRCRRRANTAAETSRRRRRQALAESSGDGSIADRFTDRGDRGGD